MSQNDTLLVTPKQAAELLGVSRACLYRLLQANEIQSFTLPGTRCRRIPVEDLKRWIDRLRAGESQSL